MTHTEMMKTFDLLIDSAEYHDDELAVSLLTKIKNELTIHHQPPTVEEVGDEEECVWFIYKHRSFRTGCHVRRHWLDGDRWMRLPKEGV